MKKKITQQEFEERAGKKHDYYYLYYLSIYTKFHDKVLIICPKHGKFYQGAGLHLNGRGCPKCGIEKNHNSSRKSTEQFTLDAINVHGNFYDYSLVVYKGNKIKVKIICPIHGIFEQRAGNHVNNKQGCPGCKKDKIKFNIMSSELYVEKANEVHGFIYFYNKLIYSGAHKNVTITCPIHGDFEQVAYRHLQKNGCPKCHGSFLKTTVRFIKDAISMHGLLYFYHLSEYKGSKRKVKGK